MTQPSAPVQADPVAGLAGRRSQAQPWRGALEHREAGDIDGHGNRSGCREIGQHAETARHDDADRTRRTKPHVSRQQIKTLDVETATAKGDAASQPRERRLRRAQIVSGAGKVEADLRAVDASLDTEHSQLECECAAEHEAAIGADDRIAGYRNVHAGQRWRGRTNQEPLVVDRVRAAEEERQIHLSGKCLGRHRDNSGQDRQTEHQRAPARPQNCIHR